jgi:hypothetical protein
VWHRTTIISGRNKLYSMPGGRIQRGRRCIHKVGRILGIIVCILTRTSCSSWPTGSTNDLPYDYTTSCIGACTAWTSDDGVSIHSGFGDSSLYGSYPLVCTLTNSFDLWLGIR